jgi:hypothetical protein
VRGTTARGGAVGRILAAGWSAAWRYGLAVPIILGLVLVAGIAVSLLSDGYKAPTLARAGFVSDFEPGAPELEETEGVWVVRLPETDEMLALSETDPLSNCTIGWRPDYHYLGRYGWFVDACRGSVYDLAGRCFGGPCVRGMSRFGVMLQASEVIVELTKLEAGPPRDEEAEPITPAH